MYRDMLILPGALFSALSVYIILSYLIIPSKITLPGSILIFTLVFGLTSYYVRTTTMPSQNTRIGRGEEVKRKAHQYNDGVSIWNIIFIGIYISTLLIVASLPRSNQDLFIPWVQLTPINITNLVAAIALSFFLPGYTLISALDRKRELEPYILSMFVTGFIGYITASLGFAVSDMNIPIIIVHVLILFSFVIHQTRRMILSRGHHYVRRYYGLSFSSFLSDSRNKFWTLLRDNGSEVVVFSSLFTFVVLSTYYLYSGTIIGDQWFHHGRALMFMSGTYKDIAVSGMDGTYPPFLSALLSSFFTISGSPSVNAYASINFLNIVPVFAFYFFFTRWVPTSMRGAGLLAATLFMLSSGFGWVYVLNMAITHHITSQLSALDTLFHGTTKTFDIVYANTFINVGDPSITTGLIIIALPAGFVLLGLVKEKTLSSKSKNNFIIVAAISALGILSHDEFYLFIIAGSIIVLIFRLTDRNYFFAGVLAAILIAISVEVIFPGNYYIARKIFGVPLIVLCLFFVGLMWGLYVSRTLYNDWILRIINRFRTLHLETKIRNYHIRLALSIVLLSVIGYLYIYSFVVWGGLSEKDVYVNVNFGQTVPWYFYPMKFGVTGLFGLAFIFYYLFNKRRIEKEVFIFGIIAIIAFLAGPYYNEHRLGKYIMVGMAGFASLLIYKIIVFLMQQHPDVKPFVSGGLIGIVITSSSLSIFMYVGYFAMVLENPLYRNQVEVRRDFPSLSEIRLLDFLRNATIDSRAYNVALPSNQYNLNNGFIAKLEGFSGLPRAKLLQSPRTLNASTLEGLYDLLDYSDSRYILLPKSDIDRAGGGMRSESMKGGGLSEALQFALEHFKRPYEDNNYTVLAVPNLSPPSSKGDVALVYEKNTSDIDKLLVPSQKLYESYHRYYPLNALALSRISYGTFLKDDFSALSKKNVVLTFDPSWNDVSTYLRFVKTGATFVVINTDNNFEGGFSRLLSIIPGRMTEFDGITQFGDRQHTIKIPGLVKNIELKSSDVTIKSYYMNNNNQLVAPFAIEKKYDAGRIVFVNAFGYFDAISRSPDRYFLTLGNISHLMDLQASKYTKPHHN
jgi:hypothetical protein